MLKIHFAPIQGQTDYIYRQLHNAVAGGIDCYYTPFVRLEKNNLRNKDLRDILKENNQNIKVIPQIICNGKEEFCRLCDLVEAQGWNEIDINIGCPFPMQVHAKRGAGLLPHPELIEEIIKEIEQRKEVNFSIKMRSGLNNINEGKQIITMLNDVPIKQITIHPRLGIQQYKGVANHEVFKELAKLSQKPLIYNGDITTPEEIEILEQHFPNLAGVMIGRGLLSRPSLAKEYKEKRELSSKEQLSILLKIHDKIFAYIQQHYQGDSQILSRMQSFWEYAIIDKKIFKRITKCGSLRNYREAIVMLDRDNAN